MKRTIAQFFVVLLWPGLAHANAGVMISLGVPFLLLALLLASYVLGKINSFRHNKLGFGGEVDYLPVFLTTLKRNWSLRFKFNQESLVFVIGAGTLEKEETYEERIEKIAQSIKPHKFGKIEKGVLCYYAYFQPDFGTIGQEDFVGKSLGRNSTGGLSGTVSNSGEFLSFTSDWVDKTLSEIQLTKAVRSKLMFAYDVRDVQFDGNTYRAKLHLKSRGAPSN